MSDIPNTTRAQTRFLRTLRKNPTSFPTDHWPSPLLLRRWLRKPAFRKALNRLLNALHYEADLQLACATTHAALQLNTALRSTAADLPILLATLRLSHLRQHARVTADIRAGRHK